MNNDFLTLKKRKEIKQLLIEVLNSDSEKTFFSFSYFMGNRLHQFIFKSRHWLEGYEIILAEGMSADILPAIYDSIWLKNNAEGIYQLYRIIFSERRYSSTLIETKSVSGSSNDVLSQADYTAITHKDYVLVLIDFLSHNDFMKKYGMVTDP